MDVDRRRTASSSRFFAVIIAAFVLTVWCLNSTASGFIFYKLYPNDPDESTLFSEYSSLSFEKDSLNFTPAGTKTTTTVKKSCYIAKIEIPTLSSSLTSEADIEPFKTALKRLSSAAQQYPKFQRKAGTSLQSIGYVVSQWDKGLIVRNGKWVPKDSKMDESSKSFTYEDKTINNPVLKSFSGSKAQIMHSSGFLTVDVDKLSDEQVSFLNGTSSLVTISKAMPVTVSVPEVGNGSAPVPSAKPADPLAAAVSKLSDVGKVKEGDPLVFTASRDFTGDRLKSDLHTLLMHTSPKHFCSGLWASENEMLSLCDRRDFRDVVPGNLSDMSNSVSEGGVVLRIDKRNRLTSAGIYPRFSKDSTDSIRRMVDGYPRQEILDEYLRRLVIAEDGNIDAIRADVLFGLMRGFAIEDSGTERSAFVGPLIDVTAKIGSTYTLKPDGSQSYPQWVELFGFSLSPSNRFGSKLYKSIHPKYQTKFFEPLGFPTGSFQEEKKFFGISKPVNVRFNYNIETVWTEKFPSSIKVTIDLSPMKESLYKTAENEQVKLAATKILEADPESNMVPTVEGKEFMDMPLHVANPVSGGVEIQFLNISVSEFGKLYKDGAWKKVNDNLHVLTVKGKDDLSGGKISAKFEFARIQEGVVISRVTVNSKELTHQEIMDFGWNSSAVFLQKKKEGEL